MKRENEVDEKEASSVNCSLVNGCMKTSIGICASMNEYI